MLNKYYGYSYVLEICLTLLPSLESILYAPTSAYVISTVRSTTEET
jgi:hypothetical protein